MSVPGAEARRRLVEETLVVAEAELGPEVGHGRRNLPATTGGLAEVRALDEGTHACRQRRLRRRGVAGLEASVVAVHDFARPGPDAFGARAGPAGAEQERGGQSSR